MPASNSEKIKNFLSGKGKPLWTALSVLPLLFAVLVALYYIWGPGEGYFHSDCTDNLIWAEVSIESGSVFDPEFRYAGMLPFSAAFWIVPLIRIFGYGMTAHNIGMSVFALLFIASVVFFCRSAKMTWGWSSLAAFASVAAMSASDKLREIMYGHNIYYSIGPCLLLFALGLAIRISDSLSSGKKSGIKQTVLLAVRIILFLFVCGGAATDGGQVIVIGTFPAVAGILADRFFSREKLASRKNIPAAAIVGLFAMGTLVGMMLLKVWKGDIECGYAEAYSEWSKIDTWADNARAFVKQYFTLIGIIPEGSLFSLKSVVTLFRLLGGVLMIIVPPFMFVFYRKLSGPGVRALLWGHTAVFSVVMVGFVCGKLSGVNWRLTPILATGSVLCVLAARELCLAAKAKKAGPGEEDKGTDEEKTGENAGGAPAAGRIGALLLVFVMIFSLTVSFEILKMPKDYGRDNYNHELAAFLEEHGLEYGYATFWQSQTITALSDGKVKCREILARKQAGVYSDYYQSSRRWYRDIDSDRFFVLLSDGEYDDILSTASWQSWIGDILIEEYTEEDGLVPGFLIFVFSQNPLEYLPG